MRPTSALDEGEGSAHGRVGILVTRALRKSISSFRSKHGDDDRDTEAGDGRTVGTRRRFARQSVEAVAQPALGAVPFRPPAVAQLGQAADAEAGLLQLIKQINEEVHGLYQKPRKDLAKKTQQEQQQQPQEGADKHGHRHHHQYQIDAAPPAVSWLAESNRAHALLPSMRARQQREARFKQRSPNRRADGTLMSCSIFKPQSLSALRMTIDQKPSAEESGDEASTSSSSSSGCSSPSSGRDRSSGEESAFQGTGSSASAGAALSDVCNRQRGEDFVDTDAMAVEVHDMLASLRTEARVKQLAELNSYFNSKLLDVLSHEEALRTKEEDISKAAEENDVDKMQASVYDKELHVYKLLLNYHGGTQRLAMGPHAQSTVLDSQSGNRPEEERDARQLRSDLLACHITARQEQGEEGATLELQEKRRKGANLAREADAARVTKLILDMQEMVDMKVTAVKLFRAKLDAFQRGLDNLKAGMMRSDYLLTHDQETLEIIRHVREFDPLEGWPSRDNNLHTETDKWEDILVQIQECEDLRRETSRIQIETNGLCADSPLKKLAAAPKSQLFFSLFKHEEERRWEAEFECRQKELHEIEKQLVQFKELEQNSETSLVLVRDSMRKLQEACLQASRNMQVGSLPSSNQDDMLLLNELKVINEEWDRQQEAKHMQIMATLEATRDQLFDDGRKREEEVEAIEQTMASERADESKARERLLLAKGKLNEEEAEFKMLPKVQLAPHRQRLQHIDTMNSALEAQVISAMRKKVNSKKAHDQERRLHEDARRIVQDEYKVIAASQAGARKSINFKALAAVAKFRRARQTVGRQVPTDQAEAPECQVEGGETPTQPKTKRFSNRRGSTVRHTKSEGGDAGSPKVTFRGGGSFAKMGRSSTRSLKSVHATPPEPRRKPVKEASEGAMDNVTKSSSLPTRSVLKKSVEYSPDTAEAAEDPHSKTQGRQSASAAAADAALRLPQQGPRMSNMVRVRTEPGLQEQGREDDLNTGVGMSHATSDFTSEMYRQPSPGRQTTPGRQTSDGLCRQTSLGQKKKKRLAFFTCDQPEEEPVLKLPEGLKASSTVRVLLKISDEFDDKADGDSPTLSGSWSLSNPVGRRAAIRGGFGVSEVGVNDVDALDPCLEGETLDVPAIKSRINELKADELKNLEKFLDFQMQIGDVNEQIKALEDMLMSDLELQSREELNLELEDPGAVLRRRAETLKNNMKNKRKQVSKLQQQVCSIQEMLNHSAKVFRRGGTGLDKLKRRILVAIDMALQPLNVAPLVPTKGKQARRLAASSQRASRLSTMQDTRPSSGWSVLRGLYSNPVRQSSIATTVPDHPMSMSPSPPPSFSSASSIKLNNEGSRPSSRGP